MSHDCVTILTGRTLQQHLAAKVSDGMLTLFPWKFSITCTSA